MNQCRNETEGRKEKKSSLHLALHKMKMKRSTLRFKKNGKLTKRQEIKKAKESDFNSLTSVMEQNQP